MGCLKILENGGARQISENHFFLGKDYAKKEVPLKKCDDYLPFGLSFNSYSRAAITAQNFKFNAGSELEEMTDWYSTPFRKYDPSLGRFHGVDKLAELYTNVTPSHFGLNNPINYNDPTGLTTQPSGAPEGDDDSGQGGDSGGDSWAWMRTTEFSMHGYDDHLASATRGHGGANTGMSAIIGSGTHWSDIYYGYLGGVGIVRNARMMSRRTFLKFYNVTNSNRFDLALSAAAANEQRMLNYIKTKLKKLQKKLDKDNSIYQSEEEFLATATASAEPDKGQNELSRNDAAMILAMETMVDAYLTAGAGALAELGAAYFLGRLGVMVAATRWGSRLVIQFGKSANQISHAFRHTDKLGLDRALVESSITSHLRKVSSNMVTGKPFNQIIEIAGHRVQYTAYKLKDGIINIGRIHGIN